MSKIARYQGNLRAFASNAEGLERTLFGETTQADDLTSQVTAAFLRGWGIVGASEHPSLEDFNGAMFAMSQFLAYQHQVGVPEWHVEQEYYVGSICTHGGESYQSLENNNVGSAPPSARWTPVLTAKNGLSNLRLGAGTPPIGIPFYWPSSEMPNTVMPEWADMVFLKFNGATFSATTYPKLALVLPGLKLPETRGEFIRVWDDGRGVDSGRALMSAQGDAIRNIIGKVGFTGNGLFTTATGAFTGVARDNDIGMSGSSQPGGTWYKSADFNASTVVPTATENRPRNVAFNFLVRAK